MDSRHEHDSVRTVVATRYVTPLREGGSLPAIIEADDDGLYVLKFRGAGQGVKALIAELLAGEIARSCGLPVPEIVLVELDPDLARTEPDAEIQDLIRASSGLNLALDYLPGSLSFDPLADVPSVATELASRVVWFDAFVANLDRTARNTNMLCWHRKLWLIDHGAALYFQHDWSTLMAHADDPFGLIRQHVLLPAASELVAADQAMTAGLGSSELKRIVDLLPASWLDADDDFIAKPGGKKEPRATYLDFLNARLHAHSFFLEEALRAHAHHV